MHPSLRQSCWRQKYRQTPGGGGTASPSRQEVSGPFGVFRGAAFPLSLPGASLSPTRVSSLPASALALMRPRGSSRASAVPQAEEEPLQLHHLDSLEASDAQPRLEARRRCRQWALVRTETADAGTVAVDSWCVDWLRGVRAEYDAMLQLVYADGLQSLCGGS